MKSKFHKTIAVIITLVIMTAISYSILTYLFPREYSEYVIQYSKAYKIDENLVYAIIKCESNFSKESVSHAGAIGLMQITPDTLEWAALKNKDAEVTSTSLYDPSVNIKYGCFIYSLFFNEFKTCELALASYNAGRGNVLSWLKDSRYSDDGTTLKNIPFSETNKYVKKVINTKKIYDLIYSRRLENGR